MNVPALIFAGDTVKWSEPATSEHNSASWTRTVSLRHRTDADVLNIVGVAAAGGGWDFTITATQSATLGTGTVWFQDYVTAGSERFTLGNGSIEVQANVAVTTGAFDGRSQFEQDLDAVRAEMRARITGGSVQEYSIGNRSLKKMPMSDLIAMESKLKADVARETRRKRIAQGLDSGRAVYVRFGG